MKTKKLCKGEKVFLRSGFSSTSNMKAFIGFLYTGRMNVNIMSMKNFMKNEELLKTLDLKL